MEAIICYHTGECDIAAVLGNIAIRPLPFLELLVDVLLKILASLALDIYNHKIDRIGMNSQRRVQLAFTKLTWFIYGCSCCVSDPGAYMHT